MNRFDRVLRFVPVTLVMGTIFFLSHQTGEELSLPPMPGLDKLGHGLLYGILAAAAIYAIRASARVSLKNCLLIVLFCFLYGVTDEFHQSFIPGRESSLGDLLADAAGAALVSVLWFRYRNTPQGKPLPRSDRQALE